MFAEHSLFHYRPESDFRNDDRSHKCGAAPRPGNLKTEEYNAKTVTKNQREIVTNKHNQTELLLGRKNSRNLIYSRTISKAVILHVHFRLYIFPRLSLGFTFSRSTFCIHRKGLKTPSFGSFIWCKVKIMFFLSFGKKICFYSMKNNAEL